MVKVRLLPVTMNQMTALVTVLVRLLELVTKEFVNLENNMDYDEAYAIFEKYGDSDMDYDEIVLLLTMNDIGERLARQVALDIRP